MDQATQVVVDELVGNAHGNLERVKEIVVNKPDLMNAKASWNETPLEAATQMGPWTRPGRIIRMAGARPFPS